MEQQLAAGLGKGQIAEFVENEEIDTGEPIGDAAIAPTLASVSIRWHLNRKQIIALTGMSRSTLDRLERDGKFQSA